MYVYGEDTVTTTNGLQQILDRESGNGRPPNSKLTVGPVSENDGRQSTYQCAIHLSAVTTINSTTAFLTVIGAYVMLWHYNKEHFQVFPYN